jgi:hypothetical protein
MHARSNKGGKMHTSELFRFVVRRELFSYYTFDHKNDRLTT